MDTDHQSIIDSLMSVHSKIDKIDALNIDNLAAMAKDIKVISDKVDTLISALIKAETARVASAQAADAAFTTEVPKAVPETPKV